MEIVLIKQVRKEIQEIPKDLLEDVFALFDDLMEEKKLSMPISRPLFSIAKGLHELRLSGKAGDYRVFYVIKVGDAIYVLHACEKKKQAIDKQTGNLLKLRLRSIGL